MDITNYINKLANQKERRTLMWDNGESVLDIIISHPAPNGNQYMTFQDYEGGRSLYTEYRMYDASIDDMFKQSVINYCDRLEAKGNKDWVVVEDPKNDESKYANWKNYFIVKQKWGVA